MKKFLILVVLVSLVIYFAGCTGGTKTQTGNENNVPADNTEGTNEETNSNENARLVDCGSDPACWETNLENCTPAKFETGLGDQIRFLFTIEGVEGENCKIHHLATKNPSPDFEGTYYDCLVPKDALDYEAYEEWIEANLLTSCTGTFVDVSIDLYGSPNCMKMSLRAGGGLTSDEVTGGKKFTLEGIGSNEEITVKVDEITGTVAHSEKKTVNGVSVENIEIQENGMAQMEVCSN